VHLIGLLLKSGTYESLCKRDCALCFGKGFLTIHIFIKQRFHVFQCNQYRQYVIWSCGVCLSTVAYILKENVSSKYYLASLKNWHITRPWLLTNGLLEKWSKDKHEPWYHGKYSVIVWSSILLVSMLQTVYQCIQLLSGGCKVNKGNCIPVSTCSC
jgi:hypothetical protein